MAMEAVELLTEDVVDESMRVSEIRARIVEVMVRNMIRRAIPP
jgi:hypothetical protein